MNESEKLPFEEGYIPPKEVTYDTGKRELRFGAAVVVVCAALVDFVLYGGLNLGFALAAVALIATSTVYLCRSGKKITPYSGALLGLSVVIAASFVRSDDAFVKFVMVCFLCVSVPLGLTIQAGQSTRDPAGVLSLHDAPRAVLCLGLGKLPEALRGLSAAGKKVEKANKSSAAVLLGLVVALPLVIILLLLLASADAAFEGLLNLLPAINGEEPMVVIIFTCFAAPVVYTLCVALVQETPAQATQIRFFRLHPLTVNTVLGAVTAVYVVYLASQLAYFVGGLSGILPENYTLAEYARRGFFEMVLLCLLNLCVIAAAAAFSRSEKGNLPLLTRIFCAGIGMVSLFFVVSASAKMLLYIHAFGLTRLRVLTEVIMLFLGLTTILVTIWLFQPKFAYMKAVLLLGLSMGALVSWVDVDTAVAAYNVSAYQAGKLDNIDLSHLSSLSSGATPYIATLLDAPDKTVAQRARSILERKAAAQAEFDIRSFTIGEGIARPILDAHRKTDQSPWHSDFPEWSEQTENPQ